MTVTNSSNGSRKTWISILIGMAIVIALACLALVAGGIYVASKYMSSQVVASEVADGEFDRALAKFAGSTPLVQLRGEEVVVHRTPDRPRQRLTSVHVLAYDERHEKLVNVTVPGWFLRALPGEHPSVKVDGVDVLDEIHGHISLEDLERHGPGLVMDGHGRRGGRIVVWTE